jgi:ectoine hydroxylase-related dioxygenase (phytanoyl-CoA dioxygenase family)
MMAINPCKIENGCLEVLAGSHKLGRIDHGIVGKQTGADMQRVNEAEKFCKKIFVELNPGDALFFHCNLLHCSAPNQSDIPRVTYIACYNKKTNSPFGKKNDQGHPVYKKIIKVKDEDIIPHSFA